MESLILVMTILAFASGDETGPAAERLEENRPQSVRNVPVDSPEQASAVVPKSHQHVMVARRNADGSISVECRIRHELDEKPGRTGQEPN